MSIHDGHRDRMRRQLKTSGMDSLSDVQVLEVLLYYAAPRGDTNPTAHALLSRFGTLDSVFRAGIRAEKSKRRRRRRRAADPARAAGGAALPHEPQRTD